MVKTDQAMQQLPCRSKASASPAEDAQNTARKHLWTVGGRIAKYFDRRLPGLQTQGSKGAQKGSTLKGSLSGTGTRSPRAHKSKQGIVPDQLAALVSPAISLLGVLRPIPFGVGVICDSFFFRSFLHSFATAHKA